MSTIRWMRKHWAYTLTVFRACLPRRGRKGNDDASLRRSISSRSRTFDVNASFLLDFKAEHRGRALASNRGKPASG